MDIFSYRVNYSMCFIKIFFVFNFSLFFLDLSFFPSLERNTCFSDKNPLILSYCLGTASRQRFSGLEDSSKEKNSLDSLRTQAFNTGHWVDIKALIVEYPDSLNDTDGEGNTLLHLSIQQEKLDVTKNLLHEKNLNLNLQNNNQETPLSLLYQLRIERISKKNFFQLLWYWISPSGRKDRKKIDRLIKDLKKQEAEVSVESVEKQIKILIGMKGFIQKHLIKWIDNQLCLLLGIDMDAKSIDKVVMVGSLPLLCYLIEQKKWDVMEDIDTVLFWVISEGMLDISNYLLEQYRLKFDKQYQPRKELLDFAIKENKVDMIQYIMTHTDINFDKMEPFLSLAIESESMDIVHYFLTHNEQMKNLGLNLSWSDFKDKLDILKYCVQKGINIHLIDSQGNTLLYEAMETENWEFIEYCLSHGFDLYFENKEGLTSIDILYKLDGSNVMKHLIEKHYVDVNREKEKKKPILIRWAISKGEISIFKNLILQLRTLTDINFTDGDNRTILSYIAEHGTVEMMQYCVEQGADINFKNGHNQKVFHYAAAGGDLNMMEYLIKEDTPIDVADKAGKTMLHYAAEGGYFNIVDYLVGKDANIKLKDKEGKTLLHYLAEYGTVERMRYLVTQGVDINHQEKHNKKTVLHYIVEEGTVKMLRECLSLGADIKIEDEDGKTVLHYAAQSGNVAIMQYLVEQGVDIKLKDRNKKTVLYYAAQSGNVAMMKYLVEQGVDIKLKDRNKKTVLHYVAESGNVAMMKYLVEQGVDIKLKARNKKTVLHYAAESGNVAMMKYLVEQGVDIKLKDRNKKTVLHYVAESGNVAMMKYLLEHGPKWNIKGSSGFTVLDVAKNDRNKEALKILNEFIEQQQTERSA